MKIILLLIFQFVLFYWLFLPYCTKLILFCALDSAILKGKHITLKKDCSLLDCYVLDETPSLSPSNRIKGRLSAGISFFRILFSHFPFFFQFTELVFCARREAFVDQLFFLKKRKLSLAEKVIFSTPCSTISRFSFSA